MLRLAAGETMAGLVKEAGILRKSLYEWRDAYRKFGVAGLNQRRGPKPGSGRRAEKPPARPASGGSGSGDYSGHASLKNLAM